VVQTGKQGPDFNKKYMIYDVALVWINYALCFANYCMGVYLGAR